MNDARWIWIVAILGPVIGVAGGLLGTYFSIRNAKGPRERALMIRAALLCWLLVMTFAAGVFLIPTWHKHLLWAPYVVVLFLLIRWCNRSQARIRQEESGGPITSRLTP
jgi:hypothetical protein